MTAQTRGAPPAQWPCCGGKTFGATPASYLFACQGLKKGDGGGVPRDMAGKSIFIMQTNAKDIQISPALESLWLFAHGKTALVGNNCEKLCRFA